MVKDRPHRDTERRVAGITMMPLFLWEGCGLNAAAVRANRTVRPADPFEVRDAIGLGREEFVNLNDVHGATSL